VNASDILSAEKRTTLFSNIPLILDLNAKFLQQLDARISKWEQSSCVGDLFVQFARTSLSCPLSSVLRRCLGLPLD
jgi:hypothetical protein